MEKQEITEKVGEISNALLTYLAATSIEPNMAQASLGNAWVKLLYGMGTTPDQFDDICDSLKEIYRKDYTCPKFD